MKAVFRFLLIALLVLSAGAAILVSTSPAEVEANPCCRAECFAAFDACVGQCGNSTSCIKACRAQRDACIAGC